MNQEQNILQEALLPMNFNIQQAKQNIQQRGQSFTPGFDDPNSSNFNPSINMNDPMVAAQVAAQKKRDEESARQQRIENFKQYSRNIIYKSFNAVNNLIKGHSHPNFTESHQQLLLISIENKVREILDENKLQIDNRILLEVMNEMLGYIKQEYATNVQRYNLVNTDKVGYNSETGTVMLNPEYLYNILAKWVSEHKMHYQENDQMVLS